MMGDARKIAAGLSEAQRAFLNLLATNDYVVTAHDRPGNHLPPQCYRVLPNPDSHGRTRFQINTLGLAVRDILREQSK